MKSNEELINGAAEKAYPATVNPNTGNDENWYNKKVWKEGAIWAMKDSCKASTEAHNQAILNNGICKNCYSSKIR